jgi:signal transduction histidine kinase
MTIFLALFTVTTCAIFAFIILLKKEKEYFINQQVREVAEALIDSQQGDLRKINFEDANAIVSEELGNSPINKFFIIQDEKGTPIFKSTEAKLLPIPIPKDKLWFETIIAGKYIRALNLQIPRFPDRSLQVGIVTDEAYVQIQFLSKTSFLFSVTVLILGLLVSFFSTSYLLRPLANLDVFLQKISKSSENKVVLPNLPSALFNNQSASSKDEFERVLMGLNLLISKVNKNYEFSRLWSYQMAHELKTPLSTLQMEIEKLHYDKNVPLHDTQEMTRELMTVADTINSFLGWAEIENSPQQKNLFMNYLSDVIGEIIEAVPEYKKRIEVQSAESALIPACPAHLKHLLQNLISNAIKHSGSNSKINIKILNNELLIEDEGPGLDQAVLDRLGEPFNRGDSSEKLGGHGLGLAWVMSICRHYGWKIYFENLTSGMRVSLKFS